jgi:vacuolar-type H+-ATPase subunit H
MAKTNSDNISKNDEFSRIFDEYRAKIEEITRRTEKNLQQVDTPSDNGKEKVIEPVEVIIKKESRDENNPSEIGWRPDKAAQEIINEAKRKAERIISEAEEETRKQAKKKTQSKVDQIIEKARKDSEDIIADARQVAEKEKNAITAASKREAEELIKNITDEYRAQTQTHSSQVIAQARESAKNILTDVIASSNEISQLIMNIVNKARSTIDGLEKSLQSDIDELSGIIVETRARMEEVATASKQTEERPEGGEKKAKRISADDADELQEETDIFVRFIGERINGYNGKGPLFSGQMEIKAVSSFEYKQIRNIKNHLVNIPNIKYMQENASEKEMSVLFEIKEPLPLLDIFNSFPQVDRVTPIDDGITLTLKSHS